MIDFHKPCHDHLLLFIASFNKKLAILESLFETLDHLCWFAYFFKRKKKRDQRGQTVAALKSALRFLQELQ